MLSQNNTRRPSSMTTSLFYLLSILCLVGGIAIYLFGIKAFIDNGAFEAVEFGYPDELRFRESPYSIFFVIVECAAIFFAFRYSSAKAKSNSSKSHRVWPIVVVSLLSIIFGLGNVSAAVIVVTDPMGALGYIASAIAIILIAIIAASFTGSESQSSDTSTSSYIGESASRTSSASNAAGRKLTYGLNNPNFRRTRGKSFGMDVEGIFCTGAQGQEIYVCSVQDFESGKVAIFNNGKQITDVAGCKSPQ